MQRALGLWSYHLLLIAHLNQRPLVTFSQPCESDCTSEKGGAVPDVAGPDGGEGKPWDTADKLFLQRVMHRKGCSAPFPRSADPFNDPFKLSLYRHNLFLKVYTSY